MAVSLEQARAAKSAALAIFRKLADVVGVGITRVKDDYAVKVNLRAAPEPSVNLPTQVQGVPVRVEVVGSIRPR